MKELAELLNMMVGNLDSMSTETVANNVEIAKTQKWKVQC